MILEASSIESRLLGLKVSRQDIRENMDFDVELVKEQIESLQLDVVRFKVVAGNQRAIRQLYDLGCPVYFSGGIRKYQVNTFNAPIGEYSSPALEFEQYDGNQYVHLRKLLIDTWLQYPIGYYRTPTLEHLVTKQMEIECIIEYYHRNNNPNFNNQNSIWFLKIHQEYVGFLALNHIDDQTLESSIAGIIGKYRGLGMFHDVLRFIRRFAQKNEIPKFICGARNENLISQRTFESEHMMGYEVDYVFHALPMRG